MKPVLMISCKMGIYTAAIPWKVINKKQCKLPEGHNEITTTIRELEKVEVDLLKAHSVVR